MCIIVGKVASVSRTQILVAKLQDGKRQLTVYSNTISMLGDRANNKDVWFSESDPEVGEHAKLMRFFNDHDDEREKSATSIADLQPECTFRQTARKHTPQTFYQCLTCKQGPRNGVCGVCAQHCHRDHQLSPARYGNFFCDCGADNPSCVAMKTGGGVRWVPPGSTQDKDLGDQPGSALGAMILPVPNGHTCVPVDLSDYKNIFKDLKALFPSPRAQSYANKSFMFDSDNTRGNSALAVTQVGNFKVSVVPTLADFHRLRLDVFKLDTNAQNLLAKFYKDGYGFMVCQLDKGAKFHPIAYTHQLLSETELFVPTVHYHGDMHDAVDWDHDIYVWSRQSGTLQRYLNTMPFQDTLPGIHWAHAPLRDNVMLMRGFKVSVLQHHDARLKTIERKLNAALAHSSTRVRHMPCLYRVRVKSSYPYNHDTLLC